MRQRTRLLVMLVVFTLAGLAIWLVVVERRGSSPVDINSASFAELDAVPYLTPEAARGIIAGRPFESVDELLHIYGIGAVTLERIRKFVEID
ncbi:MAG: DNA uptake protein ComE-like DNA-binding protein [Pseudoalteromonas tetraodonis]|jgi:DNA uptake protein ComE-like DNA-binding protein